MNFNIREEYLNNFCHIHMLESYEALKSHTYKEYFTSYTCDFTLNKSRIYKNKMICQIVSRYLVSRLRIYIFFFVLVVKF